MKIVITGGGTGGSITPLLAIYDRLKQTDEFVFIGGKNNVEKDFAEEYKIPFKCIASGKLRRYFDLRNFAIIFQIALGFFQSARILNELKPDIIISAGSFISVPVIWAGWLLRIPALVHQQDVKKGLANALTAPFAKRITVSLPVSLKNYPRRKTFLTGNPVRKEILNADAEQAKKLFNLDPDLPVVLILGGGTGALAVNKLVTKSAPQLVFFCQIIHLAGKGKNIFQNSFLSDVHRPESIESIVNEDKMERHMNKNLERYHVYDFLHNEIKYAYSVADLVVTRAGMATLSELAVLGKTMIIIPLPGHQEKNAGYFESKGAGLVLDQKLATPELLINFIHSLLNNQEKCEEISVNAKNIMPVDAVDAVIEQIRKITKKKL